MRRPFAWLGLFSTNAEVIDAGSAYLRTVGPFYGFFGMGWALYFASQGAGQLMWPLLAGFLRLLLSVGGGWIVLKLTGSLMLFFATSAVAMCLYESIIGMVAMSGAWFHRPSASTSHR